MSWTDDKIKILRQMAEAGKSASQIGEVLGFSRSAVTGKCWRLGVQLKTFQIWAEKKALLTGAPPPPPRKREKPVATPPVVKIKKDVVDCGTPVHLKDHRESQCHFPVEKMMYCSHPRHGERPYCEGHCAVVYEKTKRLKDPAPFPFKTGRYHHG